MGSTLPDGGTFQTPNRPEAEKAYLLAVAPVLAAEVEHISARLPELATRARRAAFLVLAGAVTLAKPGEVNPTNGNRYHRTALVLARVKSQSDDGEYLITRDDCGQIICNCPDEDAPRSRIAPHTCKHILAVLMTD